jgi:chitodextrinase
MRQVVAAFSGLLVVCGVLCAASSGVKRVAVSPVSVSPGGGTGSSQSFTFSFEENSADAVDVLINNDLNGRGACFLTFVPVSTSSGYVSLADASNDGRYANGSPMLVPTASGLQNDQCTINGAGSSFSASGHTSTLTLDITFAPGFSGNKVVYTAARSVAHRTGWQASGTWNVPGAVPEGPAVRGVSPVRSATTGQTYGFSFADTNGYGALARVDILANSVLTGVGACHATFVPTSASSGYLYLADDSGDGYVNKSPIFLPSSSTLQNSQCGIRAAESSVSANGDTLTLNLAIQFNEGFAGNRVFFLAAQSKAGNQAGNHGSRNSGWQAAGSVAVAEAFSTSYTTNFPMAENPISEGGIWTNGGQPPALDFTNMQTTPGLAFGTMPPWSVNDNDSTALLTGVWGPNQTVTATVQAAGDFANGMEIEIRLHSAFAGHSCTGYEITFAAAYIEIVRWNGAINDFTVLASNTSPNWSLPGAALKATISGSTIAAYINGVQVVTATDSTFPSGSPGMGAFISAGGDPILSNLGFSSFSATDGPDVDITPPSTPSNLSAAAISSSEINLGWTASIDPNFASSQLTYGVYRNGVRIATTAAGTTSWADTSLAVSTTYTYALAAYDPAGNVSPQTAAAQATTLAPPDTTPPSAPTNLSVTGTTASSVSLSWTPSTDNVGVAGYKIYRGGVLAGTSLVTSYTNAALTASTTYTFTVAAYDAAGNVSVPSGAVQATTSAAPDTTPPAVPTNLSVTGTTSSTVSLSWTSSTDNVGVTGYNIYRGGVLAGTSVVASYTNTGLAPSTTYSFTVAAFDAARNVSAQTAAIPATTPAVPDTTPPTMPTNLSVTGTTASTVSLSWTPSTDNVAVTGYKIYQGGVLAGTSAVSSYTIAALAPSTTYSYTVAAYDAAGNVGAPSAAVQATTLVAADTTPPSVPTNLSVTGTTTSSVSLSWTPATDNVGVTGYNIYRGGVQVDTSPVTSYTNTALAASTPYSFTVAAFDAAGNVSAQSAAVQATTLASSDTTPPTTPTNLSVTGTTASSISLSWTPSSDDVAVSGYNIYQGGVLAGTAAVASYTNTALMPSTIYTYTVAAYDAAGNVSAQSSALQATTMASANPTPPAVPTNLSVTGLTASSVSLSWSASSGGAGVAGYNIYRGGALAGTSALTTYTNTGLAGSTTYSFTVAAYDAAGNVSAQSAPVQAMTLVSTDTAPPTVPTGLSVTGLTASSVSLSWTPSTDNVAVAGYNIYRGGVLAGTSTLASYTNTALAASTTYAFTVAAVDAAGNLSAQSEAVQATTRASTNTTPPTVPTNLSVTGTTASSISLSWTASDDTSVVTGYNVYRGGVLVGTSAVTSYTNTGLAAKMTYSYTVAAYDAASNVSGQSAAVQATTLASTDITPPTVPANLSVTAKTASSVSLSWTPSTDNVAVAGYNVYRGGVLAGTSTVTSFTNTGLAPSTTYTFTLAAFDAAGNVSAQSAAAQATTPAALDTTPPSVPTNLSVTGTTASTISLSWASSTDNVGVTGYRVYRGGVLTATSAVTFYTDTTVLPATTYTYTVTSYDAAGNASTQTPPVNATTAARDILAPAVSISSPASDQKISGMTTVEANAADRLGIAGVQFQLDGANLGVELTAPPYSTRWDTSQTRNGSHVLTVLARDVAGNSAVSSGIVVTIDNPSIGLDRRILPRNPKVGKPANSQPQ